MEEVPIQSRNPRRFAELIGPERAEALATTVADAARSRLEDRCVINVNSTAAGGGVAEMLRALMAYSRGAGVDARWVILTANPAFFRVTKRIHNMLLSKTIDFLLDHAKVEAVSQPTAETNE